MPPQLQQNVIGFQRGVGREVGPPVPVAVLLPNRKFAASPQASAHSGDQRVGELKARTHTRAIVCSCTVRLNSEGRLKRTSSSLISISSRLSETVCPQRLDQLLHQILRGRSAGRNRNGVDALQPFRPDFAQIVNQIRGHAGLLANLHQPPRIRTVLRTHHQQQLAQRRYRFDRQLPVLSGIANVLRRRTLNLRKPLPQPRPRCPWFRPDSGWFG